MLVAFILIAGLVLRLINLNQSLWLDEAVQAITAKESFSYIFQEIRGDFHPPLYYFLMHFWVGAFGGGEFSLRLPSVIFGIGTIYFLYKIAMHMHLKNVAILAAVFLATAPFHVYYSQEARMYSMACFLAVLSMFYFIKMSNVKSQMSKPNVKCKILDLNFSLYLISSVLLIYSDYYGFLVVLAQGIFLLIKKRYKFLIINTCFLILSYLPWLPMFVTQIKTGMLATQSLPGWGKLVNVSFLKALPLTFVKFILGRITIFDKYIYGLVSAVLFVLIGLIFRAFIISKIKDQRSKTQIKDQKHSFLIVLWFFVPLLISWITSLFVPNYQPFRLLLILPAFYLLLAGGIEGLERKRRTRWILISLIILINLVSLTLYYTNPYFHREDWRGVVNYLSGQKNSVVILPSETSAWPVKYYDSRNEIKMIYGGAEVGEISNLRDFGGFGDKTFYSKIAKTSGILPEDEATKISPLKAEYKADQNTKGVSPWVVYIRYLVPLFDPNEKILAELSARGYTKVREISFNQIPLWEFERQ